MSVYASGPGNVSVAGLSGDPTGVMPRGTPASVIFGVGFTQSHFGSAVIKDWSQLPGAAYWYDAAAATWRPVSDQRDNGSGCHLLSINTKTSPSVDQLASNNVLFAVAR